MDHFAISKYSHTYVHREGREVTGTLYSDATENFYSASPLYCKTVSQRTGHSSTGMGNNYQYKKMFSKEKIKIMHVFHYIYFQFC